MSANRQDPSDFRITRQTTKSFAISASRYDPDSGALLGALDLTGATVYFTARRRFSDTVAAIAKTSGVGGGITIDDAAGGLATLTLTPADTDAMDVGKVTRLVFSVEVVEAAGETTEIAYGYLYVDPKARLS